MSDSQNSHDQREQQLDAIIAEYYRAEEAGKALDHNEFIAQHPEFTKELTDFFADVLILHRQDRPDPQDPALEPPITPNTSRQKNSPAATVVRYFGAYEILEDLGSGGMGVVYKARHLRLKKFVALKMIRAGAFASEFEVKMFEAEARAVGRLDHPGIVAVHEVGMHAGQHFYSMDYVAGGNLSKLHRDEPVPARRATELVQQLAEAMHHAHEQGIVHRDLKPTNILLTTTGVPRITDFGLAKRMWIGEDSVAVNMTETGQILGTPGYMSPEQAEGKTNLVGIPADIYALGAVLYALLTSRAPFVGESQAHIITQVIHNEPVSPRMLNPNVPRDLETICLKCLNKEPHRRYGTAKLLADDLQRFLEGRPVLARPLSRPARVWRWCRRNPWVSGLATAVVASLVIGSIVSTSLGVVAYRNSVESDKRGAALALSLDDSQKKLAEIVKLTEERTVALDESRWQVYRFRLMRMEQLWQEKKWGHLERLLDESVPSPDEDDLRGWEWHYLKAQLDRRVWRMYEKRDTETVAVETAFDWDQHTDKLAVWRADVIDIWLVGERRLWKSIAVPVVPYGDGLLRWAPDHRHLAIGIGNVQVYVVDTKTGDIVCTIIDPDPPEGCLVSNIVWNPQGDCVAVTCNPDCIRVWSVGTEPVLLKSLEAIDDVRQQRIRWSPDQSSCVTYSYGGWAMYWSTTDWTFLHKVRLFDDWCDQPGWSPDGKRVAFAATQGMVANADDGTQLKRITDQGSPLRIVRWLDDERLVTANDAQEVRIVHVDLEKQEEIFRPYTQAVSGISIGPHEQIATVAHCESVKIWSPRAMVPEYVTLSGAPLSASALALVWHPQLNVLAFVSEQQGSNVATIWSPEAAKVESLAGTSGASGVNWKPSGDEFIVDIAGDRSQLLHWPPTDSVQPNPASTTPRMGPTNSSDGRFKVEAPIPHFREGAPFPTHPLTIIDTDGIVPTLYPKAGTGLYAYSWHPSEPLLAFAEQNRIRLCYPLRDESVWVESSCNDRVQVTHSLNWSRDGEHLLVGGRSGMILVLNGATLEVQYTLHGHTGPVTTVTLSSDGKRIVSAGLDGFLRWWDHGTGVELFKIPILQSDSIVELRFSADSRWLAGRADSGKIYVWTIASPAVFVSAAPGPVRTPTLAELTGIIEAQPESVEARLRRGRSYRERRMWAEALTDLEAALEGVAGTHYWDRSALAALHLRRGNIDAYRKICRELGDELRALPDDDRLADMVRLVCLSPVGVDDFASIMEISNTLMAKRDNEFFQRNQISVLCRLKLWKEAVEAASAFRGKYRGGLRLAQPMLFQAIAFQNLGETDAARQLFFEAKEYAEAQSPDPKAPVDWFSLDAIYTEIAFAEASELILAERQELSLKYPAPELEFPQ